MSRGAANGGADGRRTLAYIMSPSYSGSTLLTFLLAAHPRIATIGELKATAMGDVDSYRCSCGALLRSCAFWDDVAAHLGRGGHHFDVADFGTDFRSASSWCNRLLHGSVRGASFEAVRNLILRLAPGCRSRRARILERNRALIEAVCALQNGAVFVDGSKDPIRALHLLDSGWWDLRVIHLVRDGRGVVNSYMRHYGVSLEIAALEWRRTCLEIDRMRARLDPGAYRVVRYEDLCRDTARQLDGIFAFLGLDPQPARSEQRRVAHHILGNQMRLQHDAAVRIDEQWRARLTRADLQAFEALSGHINRSLGYA